MNIFGPKSNRGSNFKVEATQHQIILHTLILHLRGSFENCHKKQYYQKYKTHVVCMQQLTESIKMVEYQIYVYQVHKNIQMVTSKHSLEHGDCHSMYGF